MNRQNVIQYINTEFDTEGERLWSKYPDYLVFRNRKNKKWFAIIMDIEKSRLGLPGEGKIDIINLKCDPMLIGSLLCNKGYLPAYHMNKQYWISLVLDGSVNHKEITELINLSYEIIDSKRR